MSFREEIFLHLNPWNLGTHPPVTLQKTQPRLRIRKQERRRVRLPQKLNRWREGQKSLRKGDNVGARTNALGDSVGMCVGDIVGSFVGATVGSDDVGKRVGSVVVKTFESKGEGVSILGGVSTWLQEG